MKQSDLVLVCKEKAKDAEDKMNRAIERSVRDYNSGRLVTWNEITNMLEKYYKIVPDEDV